MEIKWIVSRACISDLLLNWTTKAAIFGWDFALPVDLYSDASNFTVSYYITQIKDGETEPLVYDSITLLLAEQNHDTYRCKQVAIVKFIKKYSNMLNA